MLGLKSKEKELKMIWEVTKNDRRSLLVGTAHYFPFSFKTSLKKILADAHIALFEGPLDSDSLAEVVNAGSKNESVDSILNHLSKETIDALCQKLFPVCGRRNPFQYFSLSPTRTENLLQTLVEGMAPWLAFFLLLSRPLSFFLIISFGWKCLSMPTKCYPSSYSVLSRVL